MDYRFIKDDHTLRLDLLLELSQKPPLFEPGETLFWDDPHISEQMLAAHLDEKIDAASRTPEIIRQTVKWLIEYLGLRPGDKVLDLGCGPGLYCALLAGAGLRVTGIDYSRRSLDYARRYAEQHGLDIEYVYQDYLTLDRENEFDVALLIYGDLCPLAPDRRDHLLRNIHRALKPDGYFVLDVSTRYLRQRSLMRSGWYVSERGFWKPGVHLVLERQFDYPEHDVHLDQYLVLEADGKLTVYRTWFQDYTLESITPVLERQGFAVRGAWSDLTGTPYAPYSDWIGLAAQRV